MRRLVVDTRVACGVRALVLVALLGLTACAELTPAATPTRAPRYAAVSTSPLVPLTTPTWPRPAPASPSRPAPRPATPASPVRATPRPGDVIGPWLRLNALPASRGGHSASLLPGGQVLVTGGATSTGGVVTPLASTDWFDPLANQWSAVGALRDARSEHTATVLRDGTVLVVGGLGESTELATAERFQPSSGTWTPAGRLVTPRAAHTASLLSDGRVLVVGGETTNSSTGRVSDVRTAEIYDPATNRWQQAGELATARSDHSAAVLRDGRVLVAGGGSVNAGRLNSVELYDPRTGGWTSGGEMEAARVGLSATLLTSGKVLVVGGSGGTDGSRPLATAELYDPKRESWSLAAPLFANRSGHAVALLADGRVLVTGGVDPATGTIVATAEQYDEVANTWLTIPMTGPRAGASLTALRDGSALLIGGQDRRESPVATVERYRPATAPAPVPTVTPTPRRPTPTPTRPYRPPIAPTAAPAPPRPIPTPTRPTRPAPAPTVTPPPTRAIVTPSPPPAPRVTPPPVVVPTRPPVPPTIAPPAPTRPRGPGITPTAAR